MNELIQKKIVICGTTRNSEQYLDSVFDNIYEINSNFYNYKIIIYENDSIDNTSTKLKKISDLDSNVLYINEAKIDLLYPLRTQRLEYIRNKLLKIAINNFNNYDYLLIMDLDDVNSTKDISSTFLRIFDYEDDIWDIQAVNQRKIYYDIWALRIKNVLEYDCWQKVNEEIKKNIPLEESTYNHVTRFQSLFNNTNNLIPVESAFGGAAIYNLKKLKECKNIKYKGLNEIGETCEHVHYHKTLKNTYNFNFFINPNWINKD